MKNLLKSILLVFAIGMFYSYHVSADDTKICKGSGEHCMTVDLGNGMTATFVKDKDSHAVVIE